MARLEVRHVMYAYLPQSIEVRVPGRARRHLLDYNVLPLPEYATAAAYSTICAHAVMELRACLLDQAILEGHDRIEVQVEGDPTVHVYTAPDWFTETRAWLRVWWARRKYRRGRQS